MKVLHLIGGGDVGGAKVHVLSLVKELSKYIDVKIISFRPGSFSEDALSMGIDIEVVKTGNIFADIKKVINIVKAEGYQIIHSHGAKANMISLITRLFVKVPTVTTVHSDYKLDYMHSLVKRLVFGSINTVALRFIGYYIGVSGNFRDMLVKRKFPSERIFVLYNGMDFNKPLNCYSREELSNKYKLNLTSEDILVGIAARLYPVKGIGTLIDAAKIVSEKNPKVKFLIGGDGEDRKSLEKKVQALGITNNVFFLGWLDDPYELMSNVDISVLTSISESFPYSILEGARFKKATISSCVGGIPDLIDHNINGYLFKPGDYNKLSEYILELADNKDKRDEMGRNIYQKASTLFSLENMCRTQLNIYKTILERTEIEKIIEDNKNSLYLKEKYDVIISGYYGFRNIGDDAMLLAVINNLRLYKDDIRLMVLSRDPAETKMTYGVDSINRVNLLHIFRIMKNARLFLYGGGNIIQDNTSTRSLLYYLSTIWMAKKRHMQVMFYANGIGPLNKSANKKLTQKTLNQVDVITLREKLSIQELEALNINKPRIEVTADPALAISACSLEEADNIFLKEGIPSSGPYIGFSVRKWQGHEKYVEIIAQVADHLSCKYCVKPVFVPMHYPDDLYIIENVVSKMKEKGFIIKNKYSVEQTLGIISKMDMFIGMRLHALIFAASLSIPFIGLVYEPKIKGFLEYIKQPSAGDVTGLNLNNLKEMAEKVWENKLEIKKQLETNVEVLKDKALENARIAVELIRRT